LARSRPTGCRPYNWNEQGKKLIEAAKKLAHDSQKK
jgi:hypothetical protein